MLGQSSLGENVHWTFSVAAESARGAYLLCFADSFVGGTEKQNLSSVISSKASTRHSERSVISPLSVISSEAEGEVERSSLRKANTNGVDFRRLSVLLVRNEYETP